MGIDIAGPVSATLEVTPATPEELTETGRLVEAAGARWRVALLDQRDLAALRAAADEARAAFGRLDILFANAGIQTFKPILEWDDADWRDTIDVNLTGTCNAIRAVAPHLVRNGGGRIIVTSSTQGRHGTKFGAAYSASKWGIIGLMKSAALELGVHKITVNAVIPGLIDTALTRHRQRYAQAVDDFDFKRATGISKPKRKPDLAPGRRSASRGLSRRRSRRSWFFLHPTKPSWSAARPTTSPAETAPTTPPRASGASAESPKALDFPDFARFSRKTGSHFVAARSSRVRRPYPPFPHRPCQGVSGTGVSGGLPSAQAKMFPTTHSAIA